MQKQSLPSRIIGNSPDAPCGPFDFWRLPLNDLHDDMAPSELTAALRERIKELNCLYGVSRLAEKHADSLADLLTELVNFLPFSWQYPDITCARITLHGKTYKSKNFQLTRWRQSAQIFIYNEPAGEVMIAYLEECPPLDEGPFLREERVLLDALAERIGSVAMRVAAEQEIQESNQQLMTERKALKEANAALRTVLTRIEEEKQKIYQDLQANVEKVLMPLLHELILRLPSSQRHYTELLRSSLEDIVSPFVNHLSQTNLSLTTTEINICHMIRNGLQTKEIASIRNVSVGTINRHRENIRRKLNLTNSDINLTTYLQSERWPARDEKATAPPRT